MEHVVNIYTKLLLAQAEIPIIKKDSKNPHFKNDYASLSNVLSVVLPILRKHGIFFTSSPVFEHNIWCAKLRLIFAETREEMVALMPLLNLADMQKLGSCITYSERYGLLGMLGISADMDDDGNDAAKKESNTAAEMNRKKANRDKIVETVTEIINAANSPEQYTELTTHPLIKDNLELKVILRDKGKKLGFEYDKKLKKFIEVENNPLAKDMDNYTLGQDDATHVTGN